MQTKQTLLQTPDKNFSKKSILAHESGQSFSKDNSKEVYTLRAKALEEA